MHKKKSKSSFCQVDHLELRQLLSTVFVSSAATGTNDGSSWINAYTDLQTALVAATSGTTIEVGQGTYKPTAGTDRTATFNLASGVTLQGGYAGTGQTNPDARDTTLYPTILSGDIGTIGDNSDNSYHVVTAYATDSTAVLDGFTVTGGNANGNSLNGQKNGGGIFNNLGGPTISNCNITGNTALHEGGGMYNKGSSATLNNCTISGNTADKGGGLYDYYSSPVLNNCSISGNHAARYGGGIYDQNDSSAVLTNCILSGNTAGIDGGAIDPNIATTTLNNCVITGNSASIDGGAFSTFTSSLVLTNCTISGNTAGSDGGAIFLDPATTATLTNCILWGDTAATTGNEIYAQAGSTATIANSDVEGGFAGTHNINADPKFIRAVGTNGASDFGDLNLKIGSPAIDVGSNDAISGTTTDIDGNPRIINDTVDMGAYEARPIIFVDGSATGTDDGSSWADAFTTLSAALANATVDSGQAIEVAQGTYTPTSGADRTATFQLIDGVSIEGGFAGQANPTAAQNVSAYPTILSGDIGTAGDKSDNSYHVVTGSGTDSTAVLDGFTITAGNAATSSFPFGTSGGGILDLSGSPTISDCIIAGNTALADGGGIYNLQSAPTLTDCTLSGNTADYGGGMYNENHSSPVLTSCIISGNVVTHSGGGMYNDEYSSPTLVDSIISGNSADNSGGGIGVYNYSSLTLINCTLTGNTATQNGGAIWENYSSTATLTNCILWGNTAPTGNEIYIDSGSSATITNSDIDQTGFTGTDNIDADPLFLDAANGDYRLPLDSPAVNAGSNAAIPNGITTDLAGDSRIINGVVDMGAYESTATVVAFSTQPASRNTAGNPFSVAVEIEDGSGNVVTDDNSTVTLNLATGPTGSSLNLTGAAVDGVATFSGIDFTIAGNNYILVATASGLPVTTTNSFTITPAAPASLTIIEQPADATAGQSIPVQVEVEDQYGNLADGSSVSVALGTAPSGATVSGTTPITSGAVDSFSNLSLTQAGSYTLTFTDASLPAVTSSSFTVNPAAASMLVFTSQPQDTLAGRTLSTINVAVEDQFGNLVTSDSSNVTLTSTPAGASTTVAANSGVASFTNLSITAGGTYTLAASDGSLTSAISNSFTITASGPHLAFAMQPANAIAGAKFSPILIDTDDTSGNIVTGGTSTITLTLSSNGKIYGSTKAKVNKKTGMATFKTVSIRAAGTYTLTATDTSDSDFTAVQSTPFTISAAAAKKLIFNPQPTNVSASTPFNVSVELVDKYGNAVDDGSTVNLVLGSHPKTAAALSLTSPVSEGFADFDSVTLDVAGPYTLKANDGKAKATSKKFVVT